MWENIALWLPINCNKCNYFKDKVIIATPWFSDSVNKQTPICRPPSMPPVDSVIIGWKDLTDFIDRHNVPVRSSAFPWYWKVNFLSNSVVLNIGQTVHKESTEQRWVTGVHSVYYVMSLMPHWAANNLYKDIIIINNLLQITTQCNWLKHTRYCTIKSITVALFFTNAFIVSKC